MTNNFKKKQQQQQQTNKKNKLKNLVKRKNFLLGSVDILQSDTNSDFQENALKENLENGDGSLFDTFITKDSLLLRQTTILIKSWNLLIFGLFKCLTAELIFGIFSETYLGSIKLS